MAKYTFKNITQPDTGGYQVRIVRRKKENSRYFSFQCWGGKEKAFIAANHWRDKMIVALKNNTVRLIQASKRNRSTGVAGISRYICWHKAKQHHILSYSVCWSDSRKKTRYKHIYVCYLEDYTADKDKQAFEMAIVFRQDWEKHADNDTLHRFNPDAYLN